MLTRFLPRPAKALARRCVRDAAGFRLRHLSLSLEEAEWWAERLKRWPGIFDGVRHNRVVVLNDGLVMDLGIVDVVERSLRTIGTWDRPVMSVLQRFLRPGDVFVDLGANVGYFTLLASRLVGSAGLVIACEPSIRALERLTRNLRLNRCSNVLLLSVAAGERCEHTRLALSNPSNIGGSAILSVATGAGTEPILTCPMDRLFAESGLRPGVVKLDLEGFELFALRGAEQWLRASTPLIVCEYTDTFLRRQGQSGSDLIEYVGSLGYRPFCPWPDAAGNLAIEELDPLNLRPDVQLDVLFVHETAIDQVRPLVSSRSVSRIPERAAFTHGGPS